MLWDMKTVVFCLQEQFELLAMDWVGSQPNGASMKQKGLCSLRNYNGSTGLHEPGTENKSEVSSFSGKAEDSLKGMKKKRMVLAWNLMRREQCWKECSLKATAKPPFIGFKCSRKKIGMVMN